MRDSIRRVSERTGKLLARLRGWLRRVMPRVAIVAAVLFISRFFLRDTFVYGEHFFGALLEFVTFLVICLTVTYYCLKAARWLKRRLLWRVRRRLVITYMFIGLTPIVLLALFGTLSSYGISNQAMERIVTTQLTTTERQTLDGAKALADAFARLPPNADERLFKEWLDERTALIRATLPGARVALWRGTTGEDVNTVGQNNDAQFVAEPLDDNSRGIGDDTTPVSAPLPGWLRGRMQWNGLAYFKSANPEASFGTPSIRTLVRGTTNERPFALLVVVPVSRALIQQYRDNTGINVRPFFTTSNIVNRGNRQVIVTDEQDAQENRDQKGSQENASNERREAKPPAALMDGKDQFGESIKGQQYIVFHPATLWSSGESSQKLVFLFDWSWAVAAQQFLGGSDIGRAWWEVLKAISIVFLVLELLALIAAALMTRAVTSTVHRLYRATEFIKRGDFSHRVRVRSHDQLGELAESFNDMAANVESLLQERVKHERLEREVEIAAEVQAQLFPRSVPELSTVEISAECRAARGVAGDYYDYVEIAPGIVTLALGDVSGKGISASLVMSNLQASLRAQAAITAERLSIAERAVAVSAGGATAAGSDRLLAAVVADADMDGALSRMSRIINEQICRSTDANRFATLFLAIYEDYTQTLRYTNAGHNHPILVRADGSVERLSQGGMMIGAFEWAVYEEASTTLQAGDLLLIFSDGISEAERAPGEEYGEKRLEEFVVKHKELSADELRHAIFGEIDLWSGEQERGDDQTLVIVKAGKQ